MSERMSALLTTLAVILAWSFVALRTTDAFYIQPSLFDYPERNLERGKRYTETQDRASSFCTGMCMYEQRKAYSDCYDLCNWTGKGASPWSRLDNKSTKFDSDVVEKENMAQMMRTGGGKTKMVSKPRQSWRKKEMFR